MTTAQAMETVFVALHRDGADDLRRAPWRGSRNPFLGHCYVACEAVAALSDEHLRPHHVRVPGYGNHWFLRGEDNRVIDPTRGQYVHEPPYAKGRGCGFLTKLPSKRCIALLAL